MSVPVGDGEQAVDVGDQPATALRLGIAEAALQVGEDLGVLRLERRRIARVGASGAAPAVWGGSHAGPRPCVARYPGILDGMSGRQNHLDGMSPTQVPALAVDDCLDRGQAGAPDTPFVTNARSGRAFETAGTAVGNVAKLNRHAASPTGLTVTFDLTKAKVTVADVNADHAAGLADVTVGDRVVVPARLPRRSPDLSGTVVARKLVDQTRASHTAGATEQTAAG